LKKRHLTNPLFYQAYVLFRGDLHSPPSPLPELQRGERSRLLSGHRYADGKLGRSQVVLVILTTLYQPNVRSTATILCLRFISVLWLRLT